MVTRTRSHAAVAILLLGVVLCSCGGRPELPPDSARLVYEHPMVTLDPHGHNDAVTGSVLAAVYEALVSGVPGGPFRPAIADRWTCPDDRTWQFRIREGVRFHDGRPLQIADVVGSLRRACFEPESALATYVEMVENVRTAEDDPSTVVVTTSRPFPLLLTRLAMIAVVPEDNDPSRPIGTGPYRWESGGTHGPVALRRWEGYWGPAPPLKQVDIRFLSDEAELERLVRLEALDVMASVSTSFLHDVPLGAGWRVVQTPSAASTLIGLNVTMPPLDDPRVREAIDLAIDRSELVADVFSKGWAEPAVSLVPPEAFGFNPARSLQPADPERARTLVEEAGATGAPVRIDCSTSAFRPLVDRIARELMSTGLEVTVVDHPYDEFYRRFETGENQVFLFSWNFRFSDSSSFLEALVHSRSPGRALGMLNGTGYADLQVDRWIELASAEPMSPTRLELIRLAIDRVMGDRPYLPLFYPARLALVREPFRIEPRSGSWVRPQEIAAADPGERRPRPL